MTLPKTTVSWAFWTVTCHFKTGFTMGVQFPIRYLSRGRSVESIAPNRPGSWDAAWASAGLMVAVEVWLREGKQNVHAALPGLELKDVKVEVENDALVIQGERGSEHEEKDDGVRRTERQYGFCRSVSLPEGAKVEQA